MTTLQSNKHFSLQINGPRSVVIGWTILCPWDFSLRDFGGVMKLKLLKKNSRSEVTLASLDDVS
jgi:hypothetical protein